jgi:hypothetical protein
MKQEKIILSFIAVLIGLLVSGAAFYFYQSTKIINPPKTNLSFHATTPTPKPKQQTIFLNLNQPNDESVTDNKTVTVSGKTIPQATIAIITASDQQIVQPSSQGNFSSTVTIDDGENIIEVKAISPNGESKTIQKTITYSTQDF